MFPRARSLFAKAARESNDVATIFTDVFDNTDAKQTVNEKLPSPTTSTLLEYDFGSSNAIAVHKAET